MLDLDNLADDENVVGAAIAALPPGPIVAQGDSESAIAQTVRRLATYAGRTVRFVAPPVVAPVAIDEPGVTVSVAADSKKR